MSVTGWLACAGVFWAMWLTGNKNRNGFLVGALAEVLWLVYAWQIHAFELGFMAIVFTGVYLRNYYRWKPTTPI